MKSKNIPPQERVESRNYSLALLRDLDNVGRVNRGRWCNDQGASIIIFLGWCLLIVISVVVAFPLDTTDGLRRW